MRYISTSDANITFTDANGKVKIVPKNRVYTHFNGDTVTFLLIERYDNEGICIFTTMAEDLQINGTTYTYEQLLDGEGISDLFSPTGLSFEVVEELPETGSDGVIYLVPNGEDSYTEYLWIADEERFELIGTTDVDLTNYYTKSESDGLFATQVVVNEEIAARIQGDADINTTLGTKADKSDTYTKTQVDDAIETSQNEINDKILEKEEVISRALNELHEEKADKTEIPDVSAFATKSELDEKANKSDIPDTSNFMTKEEYNPKETAIVEALTDLNENKADKTELPDTSTFATKTELNGKQDTLVSGTNIKTINNESILGEGNIEIQGGGMDEDTELLISSALVDLNDRKIDTTEVKENYQKKGDYATNAKVDTKANISDVPTNEDYEEAQKIMSWSLNDLNKNKADKTEIPDISNYYTKTEIDAMIGNINTILASI